MLLLLVLLVVVLVLVGGIGGTAYWRRSPVAIVQRPVPPEYIPGAAARPPMMVATRYIPAVADANPFLIIAAILIIFILVFGVGGFGYYHYYYSYYPAALPLHH